MRICHVSNYLPGFHKRTGGAEQVADSIIDLLGTDRHEIYIVSKKPEILLQKNFQFISISTIEDILPAVFSKCFELLKWYLLQFDPISWWSFQRIIKKIKPEMVHFHNINWLTLSLIYVVSKFKIPTVLSIYDYWYFCPLGMLSTAAEKKCRKFHGTHCIKCLPNKFIFIQWLLLVFRKNLFDFFMNKIDGFIVLSNSSKRILEEYGIPEEKIYIVEFISNVLTHRDNKKNSVNIDTVKLPEKEFMLFVGWIQYRKGVHIAIESMSYINRKFPELNLYIIGHTPKWEQEYIAYIKDMVKRLKLEHCIFILGKKPHNQVIEYVKKAKIVIVPEQWENMSPVIIIESMFLGKPVVAGNIGGIPEFIIDGETGILAEYDNPEDFADKIIDLLGNQPLMKKIGIAAQKFILEHLDKDKIYNKIIKVYNQIARKLCNHE